MAFIDEAIISGFIGEAISRCTDFSWIKIKEAVKDRKNKHLNIESQIYNVIVNAINIITCYKFENNQEKVCQAAEKILVGYKDVKGDNIEAVESGLQFLGQSVSSDSYIDFKKLLYQELSKDDYEELYREIRLWRQDEESSKVSRIEYSVNEVKQDVRGIKQVVLTKKKTNEEKSSSIQNLKFQNSKKQNYIKNWNSRLFLHVDNDENPITLSDAFIMPDYKMNQTIKRMGFFEEDTLDIVIKKFSNYDKTATMLIQGEPGIGKSSIVSWIADKYDSDHRFIILNFRDWSNKDLEDGLMVSIYNLLDCKKSDLESKILILDGFDEIKSLDKRNDLLNDFLMDMLDMEHFKCIITSRSTYIDNFEDFQVVVKLLPFNMDKIKQFYFKIKSKEWRNLIIDYEDTKVLGIPVILYMAIMSNIDIAKNITRPGLYDCIFAQKGGIFDKFCVEGIGYDKGGQIFRTKENIKKYLDFLQKVAFAMYENDKLVLSRKEYIIPKLKVKENYINILEFPIKYLFENTEMDIEFIHKTIYEYFVSEYIFKEIKQKIFEPNKDLACVLGLLLKHNHLSYEVLDFLKYKIDKEESNGVYCKNNLCNAFNLMIRDGMTYYTERYFRNVIKCEMHIFSNMLEIIHLWEDDYYGLHIANGNYIKCNSGLILNLKKTDLRNMNLRGADLKYADLSKADLSGCDLTGANLAESSLRGVYLTKAIIWEANLTGADLRGAIFNEIQVRYLNSRYDLQGAKVYVDKTVEIISYKQYCRKCKVYL